MSGAFAAAPADKEQDKGRVDKAKVKRYWPGKAPEWAPDQNDDAAAGAPVERVRTEVAAPVIVRRAVDDPRMRRLAASRGAATEEAREEALQRRREIRAAEVVVVRRGPRRSESPARRRAGSSEPGDEAKEDEDGEAAGADDVKDRHRHRKPRGQSTEPDSEPAEDEPRGEAEDEEEGAGRRGARRAAQQQQQEEDEEEALAARRQAVRERLLQQRKEEEARLAAAATEEEEEEEEESSEYETDSEDEGPGGRRLLKPLFVPKESRETIAEKLRLEREEEALEEKAKQRLEERKVETKAMIIERLALDEAAAKAALEGPALDVADVDTDDEAEAVEAYEAWKQRELRRIRRDREAKENQKKEAEERERLRNMTEEERAAWERANPKVQPNATKKKWKFMQKYWHKGAFFANEADDGRDDATAADILQRDYSAPTGEDRFDKTLMPKVMQVRNFGRSGRTKWKHLVAEDTTLVSTVHDPLGGAGASLAGAGAGDAGAVAAAPNFGFGSPMGGPDNMLAERLKEMQRKRERNTSAADFQKPKKFKQ